MSVQGIHSREGLIAPITRERTIIRMKLFMSLTIVLPCKPFAASRPLALEWPLFIVRTHMTFQIEAPRKRAATPRHWTQEVGILLAAPVAGASRALTGHSLLCDRDLTRQSLGRVWAKHRRRTSSEGDAG